MILVDNMKETCRTCHYWKWLDTEFNAEKNNLVDGLCKRFPPQYIGRQEHEDMPLCDGWEQPITLHHYWCGEWRLVCADSFYRPLPERFGG